MCYHKPTRNPLQSRRYFMDKTEFAAWLRKTAQGESFRIRKDQVYVLSCGTKTYTWLIDSGALFTSMQAEGGDNELANSIWLADDMVHSLDDDIMLPFHALSDSVITRFSSEEVNPLIEADADLAWHLAEYYHTQFTRTLSNYRHAALDASEVRLAHLEEMFANIPELKGERISDATLAAFMGMHRVSVSRIRKKLSDSGKNQGI